MSLPPFGKREEFLAVVSDAVAAEELIALTLSQPIKAAAVPPKQTVRPIEVSGERLYQWTAVERQQTHRNLAATATEDELARLLGRSYRNAHAFTTTADLTLRITKKGQATFGRAKPSKTAQSTTHDKPRRRLLPEGDPVPFLVAAGLMLDDGRVPKAKQAKFRQLNRFLELVDDVVGELPSDAERAGRPLRVVEFGSGKSHLAFAVRHLLADVRGLAVEIEAIDRDAGVIASATERAERLGVGGMTFRTAAIDEVELSRPVDLAIWLHACDTATDDALWKSVQAEASVILAVPCCQHEINAAMRPAGDLLASHGLLRERYAALATDALRANWLERHGYRTQVVEFIDLEHTAKNVLLRAVRRRQPLADEKRVVLEQDAATLRSRLGIDDWHLERLSSESRPVETT